MDLTTPPSDWFITTTEASQLPPPPTPPPPTPPPKKFKYEMPYSLDTYFFLSTLIKAGISGTIALFGVVSNIINLIVFYRQGPMSNSSTLVLLWLSISDLFICVASIAMAVFIVIHNHFTNFYTMKWHKLEFATIVLTRPMNLVIQITCLTTTCLTFERAVSVVFPFKVKSLFTPKRCLAAVVSLTVVLFVLESPILFYHTAHWSKDRMVFKTTTVIPYILIKIQNYVCPIGLRILSVVVVLICNIVIIWKVKISQKFRSKSAAKEGKVSPLGKQGADSALSEKDQKVSKSLKDIKLLRMIMAVSGLFVACYSLSIPHVIVFHVVFEYAVDYNWSIEHLAYGVVVVIQLINSSSNILIYYNMSSRFREEFQKCLPGLMYKRK